MPLRVKVSTVVLLVILQGAAVLLFCGWYVQLSGPCRSDPTEGKVHVLLLSSWRSGSSFVGQVFSQHPSVFYLMEPAWHVWTQLRHAGARALRMAVRDLTRSLFQCDLSVMEAYLPQFHNFSLFMWSHSRALCSPPICPLTVRGALSNQTQCYRSCGGKSLQDVQAACASYSHVVLKEVRFFELESLYPLFQDPSLDLRVIHLVRDPRAVLRSREESAPFLAGDNALVLEHKNVAKADVQFQVMQEICRSHQRMLEKAHRQPPPFLKGRYKMVRYEDVARDPLAEVSAMYDFVGLDMTTQLREWIHQLTHGKGKGSVREAFKITSRNATQVSQAWRSTLTHSKVKRVQEVCQGAMSMIGYRPVNSENEQKRLDVDLLVPREPYRFSWLPDKTEGQINKDKTA
ncbi:carbohydrate sulfotransferase 6 [Nerophis lumbriciformis]|uniref:carbohydrate sulfotransferase 6 n=1 Tax=Nerophis lumbriciformis TaxID=546530 RepID=UPI002ADF88D1|nr:carbohydrate sulfotransferase 6-like [Nerophis lumbriciformis]